jgi:hypothetical protein
LHECEEIGPPDGLEHPNAEQNRAIGEKDEDLATGDGIIAIKAREEVSIDESKAANWSARARSAEGGRRKTYNSSNPFA